MFTYSASINLKKATVSIGATALKTQHIGFLRNADEYVHDVQFCFVSVILFPLLHKM
jgi:hypothetical protein